MQSIYVQCVYGRDHVSHIKHVLIPALRNASKRKIKLFTTNFNPTCQRRLENFKDNNFELFDIANTCKTPTGFATNHNVLFRESSPQDFFVIINPDCIPHAECIDALIKRKIREKNVGIVEGRQWPFEHPKEYDSRTLETPWASGAFALIDANFYRSVGGMDEIYFLYTEDVDLSWQAWLSGYRVLYEPEASVTHFTGGPFYRSDIVSNEEYLSVRNFLVISRKFFGEQGEAQAKRLLRQIPNRDLANLAIGDYEGSIKRKVGKTYLGKKHANVKILGVNLYHNLRAL